ncbi:MAG: hypothetical protein H8D58_04450 [Candidatus Marinimicrobia bacterium]|nr:hypothetical protein [Candidatus Neomarinimicrobiota bacterium]
MKNAIIALSLSVLFSQNDTTFIRDFYQYDLNEYQSLKMELNFGLGELNISVNDKPKTISGIIEYDLKRTETDVKFSSNYGVAVLSINGETSNFQFGDNSINFDFDDDYHNALDFQLAKDIPTDLQMDFGLGEATIDLSDLSLSYFEIDCGLGEVNLELNKPNNIICERVSISSGLGEFNGIGLGNLNTKKFNLDVGLGAAMIDLRGKYDEDMDLSIDVGLGALELILPKNVNIKLRIDHSFLSSVDVDGLLSKGNDKYVSKDWDNARPTITGDISVGIGSVDVEVD